MILMWIPDQVGNDRIIAAKVVSTLCHSRESGNLERLSFCVCEGAAMISMWIPDQVGNDSIIAAGRI